MSAATQKAKEQFDRYRKEIIFAVIIFLVASVSFGLGYLANREFNHAPIVIEACSSQVQP